MTHMSGQVVLIEQRRKGASLGNSKLNVVLYLDISSALLPRDLG